jgi:hypothetical protein
MCLYLFVSYYIFVLDSRRIVCQPQTLPSFVLLPVFTERSLFTEIRLKEQNNVIKSVF